MNMNASLNGTRLSRQSLHSVLERIKRTDGDDRRSRTRVELVIPTEITTSRGNTIHGSTRDINGFGISLQHAGPVFLGDATIKFSSDSRVYCCRACVEWCRPCGGGMFQSGCRFLTKPSDKTDHGA